MGKAEISMPFNPYKCNYMFMDKACIIMYRQTDLKLETKVPYLTMHWKSLVKDNGLVGI